MGTGREEVQQILALPTDQTWNIKENAYIALKDLKKFDSAPKGGYKKDQWFEVKTRVMQESGLSPSLFIAFKDIVIINREK